ncbi:MAG: nucleotide exchange factor GrpE [Methylocystis sp.]|jgi:molecular chaperone GrpE
MSDQTNNETPQETAASDAEAGKPQLDGAPAADLESELDALRVENAAVKDRLLRALAEMENLRRRTEREVADAKTYGVTNLAREAIALADNLRRAIDSFPAEARAAMDPHVSALLEGVELTERDFLSRLSRFGVKKIEAQGSRFDPNQHEALYEIPDETQPAGTVAQVMETGYLIGERVLRPAKVGVTRGGPKAGA